MSTTVMAAPHCFRTIKREDGGVPFNQGSPRLGSEEVLSEPWVRFDGSDCVMTYGVFSHESTFLCEIGAV